MTDALTRDPPEYESLPENRIRFACVVCGAIVERRRPRDRNRLPSTCGRGCSHVLGHRNTRAPGVRDRDDWWVPIGSVDYGAGFAAHDLRFRPDGRYLRFGPPPTVTSTGDDGSDYQVYGG